MIDLNIQNYTFLIKYSKITHYYQNIKNSYNGIQGMSGWYMNMEKNWSPKYPIYNIKTNIKVFAINI